MTKKRFLGLGMLVTVVTFSMIVVGCASMSYVTPESVGSLTENELKKVQYYLSARIILSREVTNTAASTVSAGTASVAKQSHIETITITEKTPGELLDITTIKMRDGSTQPVLVVCFDKDTNRKLHFIYGNMPDVRSYRSYGETRYEPQTGFYLLAENKNKLQYGEYLYDLQITQAPPDAFTLFLGLVVAVGEPMAPSNSSAKFDGRNDKYKDNQNDKWPFLCANIEVTKKTTSSKQKASGRVVD